MLYPILKRKRNLNIHCLVVTMFDFLFYTYLMHGRRSVGDGGTRSPTFQLQKLRGI